MMHMVMHMVHLSIEIPTRIPLVEKDVDNILKHLQKEAEFLVAKLLKEKGDYCGWRG